MKKKIRKRKERKKMTERNKDGRQTKKEMKYLLFHCLPRL